MIYDDYNNVALDQVGSYSIARGLCDPLGMSQFFMHCAWFLNCSGFVDLSGCYFGEVGTLCVDFWEHPLWMAQRTSVLEMRPLIFCGGVGGGGQSSGEHFYLLFFCYSRIIWTWTSEVSHPAFSFFLPSGNLSYDLLAKEAIHFYPNIFLRNCPFGDTENVVITFLAGQARNSISASNISENFSLWVSLLSLSGLMDLGTSIIGLENRC